MIFFISMCLILMNCKNSEKPKIESFIWIQNNVTRIWQPSDLSAENYLEYVDSSNTINFAHSTIIPDTNKLINRKTDYYKSKAPKELKEMIYQFLLNKHYSQSYKESVEPNRMIIHHSDCYCIIYKFENQPERIISYHPYTITDSLKTFVEQVKSYKNLSSFAPQEPFDTKYFIEKYKKKILDGIPLAPPPCPDSIKQAIVKYRNPSE